MNIYFISLGCDKNLVDSEEMLGLLSRAGYHIVDDPETADIIVVNTCSFIGQAKQESIDTILDAAGYKENGRLKLLVAAGCMAERYKDEIAEELPEVDVIVGASSYDSIVSAIEKGLEGEKVTVDEGVDNLPERTGVRMVSTGGYTAYLKIAEGCNKNCTYCAIPLMRGHYRSIPINALVAEAERLVRDGAVELNLVAQETTLYGTDLYGKKMLPELLRRLCRLEGLRWIRILYCYPEEINDELIETMVSEPKILHYLDIPIQHSEDRILKLMGRRTTNAEIRSVVAKLKSAMPDIALRTTLITGFPGETEEEFESLYRFVNEMEFDRLGVFAYSPEEGTKACEFPDQIPDHEKERRRDEIMELQQAVSWDMNERFVGMVMDVLVEGYLYREDVYTGRTYRDAPRVDGNVFFKYDGELISGSIVKIKITDFKEYDLIGEMCYESSK